MKIAGKQLSEYVGFSSLLLVLIPVVGILRLVLSMGHVPDSLVRFASVTALVVIGTVYYAVRLSMTGFGSYLQLLMITFLINLWAQIVIAVGIISGMFIAPNIYSVSKYSRDAATWGHVEGHLFLAPTVYTIPLWLVGCLALFITKMLVSPSNPNLKGSPGAA